MLFSVCERVAFLLASLWLLPFAHAKGECYTPVVNGTAQLADEQKPCDPYAYISLCCPVGWTCFSNSVCVVTDTSSPDVQDPLGTTTRGGCTNPLWDTASCGNICLDSPSDDSLQDCGNGSWCCGASLADGSCNCQTGDGTFSIPAGTAQTIIGVSGLHSTATAVSLPSSTSKNTASTTTTGTKSSSTNSKSTTSSSTTATSTSGTKSTSSTAAASATAAPADTEDSTGNNSHLKAGLGGGLGALGIILLGLACVWLWRRYYKRRRDEHEAIRPISRDSDVEEVSAFRGPSGASGRGYSGPGGDEEGFVKTGGWRMFSDDDAEEGARTGMAERRVTGEGFEHIRPYPGT